MEILKLSFKLFQEFCNYRLHNQCMCGINEFAFEGDSCDYNDCPVVAQAKKQDAVEDSQNVNQHRKTEI